MSTVTVDDVQEALTNVIDPELGLDFVELGLIYEVEVEGGDVFVDLHAHLARLPDRARRSRSRWRSSSGELDGVNAVHPKMTFTPAWTPDMMSEEAKFALGY